MKLGALDFQKKEPHLSEADRRRGHLSAGGRFVDTEVTSFISVARTARMLQVLSRHGVCISY